MDLKNQISEYKSEKHNLAKKIEEIKKKADKEINSYNSTINQKDKKLHDYEIKINSLEFELRKQIEEYDRIKQDYNLCKDKIPVLKNKLDVIHKSKFGNDNEEEINSLKESYELTLNKRNKEIKKFENEISDLSMNLEKMKKIENLLKDELNKKDKQLSKSNEIIKSSQNENEDIAEENLLLKKELAIIKNKQFPNSNMKELETELNACKHNILLMEEGKAIFKKKIEREMEIISNKSEQNFSMVDLLNVMKQEISLLQIYVQPNDDLKQKYKELKQNEHKVLYELQKIAENQLSDSEPEYEEGI